MGDLISRKALFKAWDGLSDEIKDRDLLIDEMIRRTQDAKAVDAEPVRHGRWVDLREAYNDVPCSKCSLCGRVIIGLDSNYNYCQNCGARMDGGKNEQ